MTKISWLHLGIHQGKLTLYHLVINDSISNRMSSSKILGEVAGEISLKSKQFIYIQLSRIIHIIFNVLIRASTTTNTQYIHARLFQPIPIK